MLIKPTCQYENCNSQYTPFPPISQGIQSQNQSKEVLSPPVLVSCLNQNIEYYIPKDWRMDRKEMINLSTPPLTSMLNNSGDYSLGQALIFKQEGAYRLMAFSPDDQPLAHDWYPTLEAAQLDFTRQFDHLRIIPWVKPEWSLFYTPDPLWYRDWIHRCAGLPAPNPASC